MEKIVNRLLIITAAAAVIFGALAYVFRNAEHDNAADGDESFSVCDYIEINLLKLNVEIIPYSGDKIRVCYKNNLPLIIEHGDNSISISEDEKFVISLFPGSQSKFGLSVYLPERSYREISVVTGGGDVKIGRVDSRLVKVLTESGDILFENAVSQFSISTTEGFVSLDIEAAMKNSSILSRKGDVDVYVSEKSSVAVEFETQTGACVPEITGGRPSGNGVYGINGGARSIYAAVQEGILTIKKR
ncbi:MAG: DUF4097 family beta strand repeat protein [Oscillospiraceae bacterium]|nr:DUF4097 family beta strand repeat protein [Oscillospiraceae bacterium]